MMVEKRAKCDVADDPAAGAIHAAAMNRPPPAASPSDLLARLSHEMRTPLSAILGFAQLMESATPSLEHPQKTHIERILHAGWYLDNLITMTRELALIGSEALPLTVESVPLAAVVLDCRTLIDPQATMRGVRVTFTPFELPCFVTADRYRLQQVLVHLLSAAIDYCEVDGAIVVNCQALDSRWIRIGITGQGEGSSSEWLARLVGAFDSLEQETAPEGGSGIRLLLVRRLVELMGGSLSAQRFVGGHSLLSVDLKRTFVPMTTDRASAHDITFNASEPAAAKTIAG